MRAYARLCSGAIPVNTPGATAGYGQKQENKAVEDRLLSLIKRRGEEVALRRVRHEIRYRHFARQNECHRPGEQAKQYQYAAHDFDHSGKANERQRAKPVEIRDMGYVEQLGRPVLQI
jgi:hypothetical protein